jgi:cytochrome P450
VVVALDEDVRLVGHDRAQYCPNENTFSLWEGTPMDLAEVDVYDPDNFVDGVPHEMFTVLRREAPVFRHPCPDGGTFWCVTRHADLVTVNRDARTFSSWQGGTNIDTQAEALDTIRMMMLNMDPPEHTKLRKLVNKGFTPRMIRDLMAHLEQEAGAIVDRIADEGRAEFVEQVAAELPLIAIAEFLGVPVEERKVLFDLSNRLIGFDDPEFQTSFDDAGIAAAEMYEYANELAADRRRTPRDDIVTALIEAEVDGERLSELEFNIFFLLLAVAGNETTRNAISHGMLALVENPEQWRVLGDDPGALDSAVEEILRWASPVMHFRRTATTDTVLGGQRIEEGERVVIWHMSANRDEAVFDDPFRFDVRRDPNEHTMHVAFGGGGPHFCLGANLARAEIKVMLRELVARLDEIALAGPVRRLRSNFINGIKQMPIEFSLR